MKIPFSPPDITESEINEVADALRSGWITTGPRTKALEREVAELCNTEKAVCLNSQTAAAELTLRLLGIGEGDEVITSAYTYTATASVVCHVGARLVLADIQNGRPEMDYDQVERLVNEKTKAIIPVDIAGIPCDYDKILDIVERKKHLFRPSGRLQSAIGRIAVLSDGAHALGASRTGRQVGEIADFTAFSFHAVKNLTTAEGGALTWRIIEGVDNQEIYDTLQLLSLHGQSKDALAKTRLGAWEYDVVGTWYKCNMTDVAAAIGLAQMKRYRKMLARRRQIIEMYDRSLRPIGIETLDHYTQSHSSSGHLYITRIPKISESERSEIIEQMAERGIACNVHYKPLPMLTAYRSLGFDIKDYPNAYNFFKNEITLPLYSQLTDEMTDCVIKNYIEITKGYLK